MPPTIVIERELCSGFGARVTGRPGVVVLGEDGIAVTVGTPADADQALAIARACPMGAIRVLDEDGTVIA